MLFLWVKAIHIIGVIAWFAGIFYLPRLFVYHAGVSDAQERARFETMEARLYRIIMRPAMLIAIGFGVWALALTWQAWGTQIWVWAKIALVVVLMGYHHYCGAVIRRFASGESPHSERFFRIFNEVPALLLILIVVLVVVKPFS